MALQTLKTGQSLPIRKSNGAALTRFRLELSWNPDGTRPPYDFDVSAIETQNGVIGKSLGMGVEESRVCYYNQKSTPAATLDKDNRTGEGEGPDETIRFDLSKVHPNTTMIPAMVTLYDAKVRRQDFTQTKGARAVLVDEDTNEQLFAANLDEHLPGVTGAVFVTIEKDQANNGWKFTSVNQGFVGKELGDFFNLVGF